jgi:two-component system NtrC family sensor kinase
MRDKRSLEGQDLKEVTEYLELVQKEMARCKELTQRLLTLSEKPKARLDDLDLHRLLAETLSLLREQARAREITIETELSPELKRILADRDQIQQVFVNLILNAMEAVGSAGKVRIVSRVEGDKAIIQVIDTGKGIKEEDLERVFEPFFSKALGKKGIGLGLTICESIIRQHKGDIQIRSQYGQGTTVTMALPLNPDAVDLAASPASGVTDETGNLHPDRG